MDVKALEKVLSEANPMRKISEQVSLSIKHNNPQEIEILLEAIAESKTISKASSSILLKNTLDILEKEGLNKKQTMALYDKMISWASSNKRNLLKLDFKMRKAELLLALSEYKECLSLIDETAKVLKQTDDKLGLVRLYYLESKVYYELKNLPKAKSSLTLARSTLTFVYCPPRLQAKIDLLNGIYLADEREYKTATAHILEALEGFSIAQDKKETVRCGRYLVLMKTMEGKTKEAFATLSHKFLSPHKSDKCIEMLCKITKCVEERNLKKCNEIIHSGMQDISSDAFLMSHLVYLCDNLIDSNILKIIEPYSTISVQYIGEVLGFDIPTIENRVRRMILDGRIKGNIDQETMCIIIKTQKTKEKQHSSISEVLSVLSDATSVISSQSNK
ncbi:26S proteasome regulatory subunit N6 [Nematocida sp. LUAm3]|nr:26S proteasome regulatory subunit N6 [Nematocida sp. LUAm3]